MYVCICVYTYVYVYTYIYIYIYNCSMLYIITIELPILYIIFYYGPQGEVLHGEPQRVELLPWQLYTDCYIRMTLVSLSSLLVVLLVVEVVSSVVVVVVVEVVAVVVEVVVVVVVLLLHYIILYCFTCYHRHHCYMMQSYIGAPHGAAPR